VPQLNGWEIWGIGAVLIAVFAYTTSVASTSSL